MNNRHKTILLAAAFAAISPAAAHATPGTDHLVTICHATHSSTNPYVTITVDVASVQYEGHLNHDGDLIPAPEGGCPVPETTTTVPPVTTTVPPVTTTVPPIVTTMPPITTTTPPLVITRTLAPEPTPTTTIPTTIPTRTPLARTGSHTAALVAAALILLVLGFLLWNEADR